MAGPEHYHLEEGIYILLFYQNMSSKLSEEKEKSSLLVEEV
jgi:hypothetical protein